MSPDPSNTIFEKAVAFVNQTNRHLFITGKAGTGKTTFLRYIKEHSFKKMAVVAPTGVAAINAGGVTIHSFFQLPFGGFIPTESGFRSEANGEMNNRSSLLQNLKLTSAKRQVIKELDLLVIDEISMVRADLLDAVDTVMRHVRRQPLLPFGGVQMVYIGDLFQLPPVIKNEEWQVLQQYYQSPFFFDAQILRQVPPLYIELKKIYRQKDDVFIQILNNIRNNSCTEQDLQVLDQYYKPGFSPAKHENFITLTSHNNKAELINQRELDNLEGKLYTFNATVTGDFNERSYPAEKSLQLKIGAQIMFIKNDKGENRRFYNGKIGTVTKIEAEKILIAFNDEASSCIEVEQETWKNVRYSYSSEKDALQEETSGTFTQYPIRLAWAITIHKSQGLTFSKAVIDAGASFAPGQVYVSLSRLTGLEGLVLHSRISQHCISTDQRVVDFVKSEMAEESLQNTLVHEQKVFVRQSLIQNFSWLKIAEAVNTHLQEYEHRLIPEKDACIIWAAKLSEASNQQLDVAEKFAKQLEFLFVSCEDDGYKKLYERTKAAAAYFLSALNEQLLASTQKHIEEVKIRQKVKKYVKDLQDLVQLFLRKQQQVNQALQLAEALSNSTHINRVLQMLEENKKTEPISPAQEAAKASLAKQEKGESGRTTLQLFKQGKSIEDIAAERGLSKSTIESHLVSFVKTGEVDVLDLVSAETLDTLTAIMHEEPAAGLSAIKAKVADHISYADIRAVANYIERAKTTEATA